MITRKAYDLVIIGSGPAALTAALYAGRANLGPLVIEGPKPGGQLMGTSFVENWPGTPSILGPTLMDEMKKHAAHWGATYLTQEVTNVDLRRRPFVIQTNDRSITTRSLIIATGASPNKLGCPGENEYWGKGVTTCAICDATFYKDKKVVIVGGGDTAMENASFLRKYTDKITIIQINDTLTASASMQERIIHDKNIQIIYNSTVVAIKGNETTVTGIIMRNEKTKKESTLEADGVFVSIGLTPNSALFKNQLDLDDHGYIKGKPGSAESSVPGVFVAGDVHDYRYRQAIVAAGTGCMAALDAERFLEENREKVT